MLPLLERLLALEPDNLPYRILQAAAYSLLGRSERAQADPRADWCATSRAMSGCG